MNWKWNFGQAILVLPASALSVNATAEQLRVLLALAEDVSLASAPEALGKAAGCSAKKATESLDFWVSNGILCPPTVREAPAVKAAVSPAKSEKKLAHADEIPNYTTAEMSDMMERRSELRTLVDEGQRILGKMFNTYEVNVLLGMVEYLGMSVDYVLLLLAHCKRIDKTGLRVIERYAISLIDRGITTAEALEDCVRELEMLHALEGRVRTMFGFTNRSLSSQEKAFIASWESFGYGEEIIRKAYEITVNAIGKPQMKYTHAILDKWHAMGLKTASEIDAEIAKEQSERDAARKPSDGSFDTDDFFSSALARSFRKESDQKER